MHKYLCAFLSDNICQWNVIACLLIVWWRTLCTIIHLPSMLYLGSPRPIAVRETYMCFAYVCCLFYLLLRSSKVALVQRLLCPCTTARLLLRSGK